MAVVVKKAKELEFSIYRFGKCTDGSAEMKDVLGGKGANLAEMSKLGMPIPSGFTIPCSVSVQFKKVAKIPVARAKYLEYVWSKVDSGMAYMEKVFGHTPLVSVRSGARVSMPGMMDTILNIGLTPDNLEFWMEKLGDRVVMDSYRRLVQMYSSVVWGIPMEEFDNVLNLVKTKFGVSSDAELSVSQLQMVLNKYHTILTRLGRVFPQTIQDQLHGAIVAVFESWDNQRAKDYRKLYEIPEEWGTAVNVQSMVFGNMGDTSCTGVLFTRNPSTGENEFTGEFLVNAQGEDVVAGIRTPVSIRQLPKWNEGVSKNLFHCADVLEGHYTDMQDIEFTVQEGKLYLLQTRSGKRTARAAFKIVHDMVEEDLIEVGDVIKRLTREQLFSITQDSIDEENCIFEPNACGIAAGGGVVSGSMVLRSEDAINCKGKCILVRKETDPDDLMGMNAALGVLTATGGLTSHAAVVARGMNKSCVVGVTGLTVNEVDKFVVLDGLKFVEGCKVTLDGETGRVWFGEDIPIIHGELTQEVLTLIKWVMDLKGYMERLDLHVGMSKVDLKNMVERIVGSSVYINMGLLELDMGFGKDVVDRMAFLGEVLKESKVSEIVVDMTSLPDFYEQVDKMYDLVVGTNIRPTYDEKISMIMQWPEEVLKKVAVKPPEDCVVKAGDFELLGLKPVRQVLNVADLLNVNGLYEISDKTITAVFGSKEVYVAMKEAIELKFGKNFEEEGTREIQSSVYWYQIFGR